MDDLDALFAEEDAAEPGSSIQEPPADGMADAGQDDAGETPAPELPDDEKPYEGDPPPEVPVYENLCKTAAREGLDTLWVQRRLTERDCAFTIYDGVVTSIDNFTWKARNEVLDLIAAKRWETMPTVDREALVKNVLRERDTIIKENKLDDDTAMELWYKSILLDNPERIDWNRHYKFRSLVWQSKQHPTGIPEEGVDYTLWGKIQTDKIERLRVAALEATKIAKPGLHQQQMIVEFAEAWGMPMEEICATWKGVCEGKDNVTKGKLKSFFERVEMRIHQVKNQELAFGLSAAAAQAAVANVEYLPSDATLERGHLVTIRPEAEAKPVTIFDQSKRPPNLPAVIDQTPLKDPGETALMVHLGNGQWDEITMSECFSLIGRPETEASQFHIDNERAAAWFVDKVRMLQISTEETLKQAASIVKRNLRVINGLMGFYGGELRDWTLEQLPRFKTGKHAGELREKSLPLLTDTMTFPGDICLRKTGGAKVVDEFKFEGWKREQLQTAMAYLQEALDKGELPNGDQIVDPDYAETYKGCFKIEVKVRWNKTKLMAAVEERGVFVDGVELTEANEAGEIAIGAGRRPWSLNKTKELLTEPLKKLKLTYLQEAGSDDSDVVDADVKEIA